MKSFYPVFAEEIYKIEKEIFKSDSTYEENEALRNAVHSAVGFTCPGIDVRKRKAPFGIFCDICAFSI